MQLVCCQRPVCRSVHSRTNCRAVLGFSKMQDVHLNNVLPLTKKQLEWSTGGGKRTWCQEVHSEKQKKASMCSWFEMKKLQDAECRTGKEKKKRLWCMQMTSKPGQLQQSGRLIPREGMCQLLCTFQTHFSICSMTTTMSNFQCLFDHEQV